MREIKRIDFQNGLRLLMEKRPNTKKAALLIGVKVGPVNENDKISGISHFNEHLLFKSNRYRTTRQIIEDLEYSGTIVNAYTTWKYTAFYAKTPYRELNNVIQILFEAATNFNYREDEFELERQVILTEIQNYINSPEKYSILGLFIPTLFKGTALERKIEGTVKSITLMKKNDLEKFKKRFYKPNNMVISICGRFDERVLLEKIGDTFGSMKRGGSVKDENIEIKNKKLYREERRKDINQMYLALGYRVPGYQSDDYFKLDILSSILSEGLSSRMFYELREKRGIGYSVGSLYHPFGKEGMFFTHVDGFDPSRLNETKETILKIFENLKNKKIPEREFRGTKKLIISRYDDKLENITDRAILMLESEFYNIPFDFRKKNKLIKGVSKYDIMSAARDYLDENYTLTILKQDDRV
ncbi:MAG: hypothetical protein DRO92_00440 [Candidatus Altiarchaeales archaeon]|nr:MAG: hypothetical protein DRO92_00440 [Candidatus Altiarchaeales archaeon]